MGGFVFSKSLSLKEVTCLAITPPVLPWGEPLFQETSLDVIYVPVQSVDLYKNARGWNYYSDLISGI